MLETNVDSFILRFVQEQTPISDRDAAAWHGVIRHVQSSEEIRFTRIEDALRFLANYIEIDGQQPFQIESGSEA